MSCLSRSGDPGGKAVKVTGTSVTVTATNSAGESVASNASAAVTPVAPKPHPTSERLSGSDRYETSSAISKATFQPGVPAVHLASGATFPDALSGAAAAAQLDGPVLLTAATALPAATKAELDRLNPKKIIILGGKGAVSESVRTAANSYVVR